MKRLPKYTPAEVRNDPYGFTYKEMSEVIGENEAKALYEELYKQLPRKKNLSMGTAVGILDQNHPMLLGPNPFDTAWGSCNPGRS